MLSQPRTARKTASNSWRRSESGTARMRMTMGLTLRRTARRINRLNGARMLILSGYAAPPDSRLRLPGALHLDLAIAQLLSSPATATNTYGSIRVTYNYPYDAAIQAELSVFNDKQNSGFTISWTRYSRYPGADMRQCVLYGDQFRIVMSRN